MDSRYKRLLVPRTSTMLDSSLMSKNERHTCKSCDVMSSYLDAIRNEVFIDETALTLARCDVERYGHIPRPSKWISRCRNHPKLTKTISAIVKCAWKLGLAHIFFAVQCARTLLALRASRRSTIAPAPETTEYRLVMSARAAEIFAKIEEPDDTCIWVTFPWVEVNIPAGVRRLDLLESLTRSDVWYALTSAWAAIAVVSRHAQLKPWVLQTYTAYQWFLSYLFVRRLQGRKVMAEHFDRWAVLADRAAGADILADAGNCGLILLQHGVVSSLSKEMDLTAMPCKLRNVTHLVAYDDASVEIFRRAIFSSHTAGAVVATIRPPTISLTAIARKSISILFVGHPLCEIFHKWLYENMQHVDISVFYKPHPLAGFDPAMKTVGWDFVTEKAEFPSVDFIVSYPSTLVAEYEQSGIPSFTHPLNIEPRGGEDLLKALEQKIRELAGAAARNQHAVQH